MTTRTPGSHEPTARHTIGARLGVDEADGRAAAWVEKLWSAVRAHDEHDALAVVSGALDAGLDAETVLLDVVGAVQYRVGVEWAANRISVADEHAATAIAERALAAVPVPRPREFRGRVTVACIDNEWHALPARLLAETLRLRGWRVDYLGAQVPTAHLISHVHKTNPAVVCLSSSLSLRLPTAHAAITACQAAGVPVMAGGLAFAADGRFARLLSADAWAPHARAAADLLATGALPAPPDTHQVADDLPHLTDQEYSLVARDTRRLTREVFQQLTARFPAMAEYDEEQLERTAEDLAHIVEFLATALYVDDTELFAHFIAWTGEILEARGVPARSLLPALDLLGEQLHDFPRSRRLLRAGRDALTQG